MIRNLCVMVLFCCVCSSVFAGQQQGYVDQTRGVVQVISPDGMMRQVKPDDPIRQHDRIRTGAEAYAVLRFPDESSVIIGAESEMLLDEYFFEPGNAESRSSMSVVKGFLRIVTGAITRLNPDRFSVRTGKAVIGIRGCEIWLRVTPLADYVYVVELPEGHTVVVTAMRQGVLLLGDDGKPVQLTIAASGEGVVIGEDGVLGRHTFGPSEMAQFRRLMELVKSSGVDEAALQALDALLQEALEELQPDVQPAKPEPPKPDPDYQS